MGFIRRNGKIEAALTGKEDLIREMWNPKKTTDQLYNIKSYGAKGDGRTDDWKALQKAVDAVYKSKSGGNLFFPPGTYRISRPLEVPELKETPPVSWLGLSPDSTSIVPMKEMDFLVHMRGSGGAVKGIKFAGTDPESGYKQYAKVCMKATGISNKLFSNAVFEWGKVHGLQITGDGNNNLCVFDRICQFSQNGTVVKGNGASGYGNTVMFAALNPKAENVHVGAYLKVGKGEGSVYHIDSVTSAGITVSPKLKKPLLPGVDYAIHIGCGLQTDRGSDNNVYGFYDCHFVGNAGTGLMVRGLYGHHIQGGNFDSNGIAGIHIGSGSLNTTPAYSGTVTHTYFENNGYANIILDFPDGLSIIEPLLAKPRDGTGEGVASITSLRGHGFDYETTGVLYNGRLYQYVEERSGNVEMEVPANVAVSREKGGADLVVSLPKAPEHQFGEELAVYVDDSGGEPVRVRCDHAKINGRDGRTGIEVPGGKGYKITAYYSRQKNSWMVSHTTPV